ncbi:hypothetical protein [uncultured Parvimonas sp.]|uniref:hypothetical protein n=1 Tax=uncultured Parvimonas sp. TaxID=747372 RepID=UPI0025971F3D|nr:hypothetical protein [uncultured Parvimonas sp.]
MKKIFKIIGTVTLIIVALILIFLVVISFMAKEKMISIINIPIQECQLKADMPLWENWKF